MVTGNEACVIYFAVCGVEGSPRGGKASLSFSLNVEECPS